MGWVAIRHVVGLRTIGFIPAMRDYILAIIKERYSDFGPTMANVICNSVHTRLVNMFSL